MVKACTDANSADYPFNEIIVKGQIELGSAKKVMLLFGSPSRGSMNVAVYFSARSSSR
jgi:hypothetical protein